jgi:hypothetical protein
LLAASSVAISAAAVTARDTAAAALTHRRKPETCPHHAAPDRGG